MPLRQPLPFLFPLTSFRLPDCPCRGHHFDQETLSHRPGPAAHQAPGPGLPLKSFPNPNLHLFCEANPSARPARGDAGATCANASRLRFLPSPTSCSRTLAEANSPRSSSSCTSADSTTRTPTNVFQVQRRSNLRGPSPRTMAKGACVCLSQCSPLPARVPPARKP